MANDPGSGSTAVHTGFWTHQAWLEMAILAPIRLQDETSDCTRSRDWGGLKFGLAHESSLSTVGITVVM